MLSKCKIIFYLKNSVTLLLENWDMAAIRYELLDVSHVL